MEKDNFQYDSDKLWGIDAVIGLNSMVALTFPLSLAIAVPAYAVFFYDKIRRERNPKSKGFNGKYQGTMSSRGIYKLGHILKERW